MNMVRAATNLTPTGTTIKVGMAGSILGAAVYFAIVSAGAPSNAPPSLRDDLVSGSGFAGSRESGPLTGSSPVDRAPMSIKDEDQEQSTKENSPSEIAAKKEAALRSQLARMSMEEMEKAVQVSEKAMYSFKPSGSDVQDTLCLLADEQALLINKLVLRSFKNDTFLVFKPGEATPRANKERIVVSCLKKRVEGTEHHLMVVLNYSDYPELLKLTRLYDEMSAIREGAIADEFNSLPGSDRERLGAAIKEYRAHMKAYSQLKKTDTEASRKELSRAIKLLDLGISRYMELHFDEQSGMALKTK